MSHWIIHSFSLFKNAHSWWNTTTVCCSERNSSCGFFFFNYFLRQSKVTGNIMFKKLISSQMTIFSKQYVSCFEPLVSCVLHVWHKRVFSQWLNAHNFLIKTDKLILSEIVTSSKHSFEWVIITCKMIHLVVKICQHTCIFYKYLWHGMFMVQNWQITCYCNEIGILPINQSSQFLTIFCSIHVKVIHVYKCVKLTCKLECSVYM